MVLYIWKYRRTGEHGEFSRIGVIDNACSVIWIRRYQKVGEFEVYVPATKELLSTVRQNELFITREKDLANAMKIVAEILKSPAQGMITIQIKED